MRTLLTMVMIPPEMLLWKKSSLTLFEGYASNFFKFPSHSMPNCFYPWSESGMTLSYGV